MGIESIQKFSVLSPSGGADSQAQIVQETNREQAEEEGTGEIVNEGSGDLEETKTASVKMQQSEFVLQYGPQTMEELQHLVGHSFKVFWDGSISLYKDTVMSSTNNKEFLNKLLDVRMHTDQH